MSKPIKFIPLLSRTQFFPTIQKVSIKYTPSLYTPPGTFETMLHLTNNDTIVLSIMWLFHVPVNTLNGYSCWDCIYFIGDASAWINTSGMTALPAIASASSGYNKCHRDCKQQAGCLMMLHCRCSHCRWWHNPQAGYIQQGLNLHFHTHRHPGLYNIKWWHNCW